MLAKNFKTLTWEVSKLKQIYNNSWNDRIPNWFLNLYDSWERHSHRVTRNFDNEHTIQVTPIWPETVLPTGSRSRIFSIPSVRPKKYPSSQPDNRKHVPRDLLPSPTISQEKKKKTHLIRSYDTVVMRQASLTVSSLLKHENHYEVFRMKWTT